MIKFLFTLKADWQNTIQYISIHRRLRKELISTYYIVKLDQLGRKCTCMLTYANLQSQGQVQGHFKVKRCAARYTLSYSYIGGWKYCWYCPYKLPRTRAVKIQVDVGHSLVKCLNVRQCYLYFSTSAGLKAEPHIIFPYFAIGRTEHPGHRMTCAQVNV